MLSNSSGSNTYPEWLDFEHLRQQGLLHIGRLSGNIWTDHNTHDPGITILEVLCYALLDLGYRNQFDTASLFARNPAQTGKTDEVFFAPAEILSVNPVTLLDFKRLLLDLPGVRNAWLQKADKQEVPVYADIPGKKLTLYSNNNTHEVKIQGLYDVYIDLEPFTPAYGNSGKTETEDQIVAAVWKQLQAHRPLCEDFKSVQVIQSETVRFCMDIDLTPDAVPEDVFVEIFEAIQQFLTPVARFYTLQEMLEKGRSIDQIFEGRPLLTDEQGRPVSHGFTDPEEMAALDPKFEVHLSDIYNLILNQLPSGGVRAIRSLVFFTEGTPAGDAWTVQLNPLKSPRLDPLQCQISYSKGQLPIQFDVASVQRKLNQRLANYYKIRRKPYELGFDIPQGKYYDLADYTSIQREFPAVYGVGEGQLPEITSRMDEKERQFRELRLRQALQLKGYLAFFDQLLANYLSQLANVRSLFALRPTVPATSSYFNTPVTSMPDASRVLRQIEAISGIPEASYTLFRRRPLATIVPVPSVEKPGFSDYNGVFATRALRDNMAYFFQKAFSDNSLSSEIIDRWETEDPKISPCDRFYYLFKLSGGGAVLCSNTFYETKTAAAEAIELARYLGFLARCYAEQDTEAGYGSALVYDPLGYADFLQHITESETTFLSRREQFLDHLLARFAEQFTEYTLLAYAMDGKAKAQPEVVADKARFLANYPTVSRNRGKGFDYTRRQVWDTDNVSGFEQRVAGFMGLDDWQRRTLHHIKLTSDILSLNTQWKWGDNVLFQTKDCTSTDSLQQLFSNNAIIKTDCGEEGLFGFKLRDTKTGCEVRYLPSFATAESRDAALLFWKNYTAGQTVETWERKDRFRFVLRDADGIMVLRSAEYFNTESAAAKAFYEATRLAMDATRYRDETRLASADQAEAFGFSLLDSDQIVLATPVYWYDTPELRDTAKAGFITTIQQCYLAFSVEKTDAALEWKILSAQGEVLLVGTHYRRAEDQVGAFETIWQTLQHARQNNGWELTLDEKGQYYWSLAKIDAQTRLFSRPEIPQNRIELARSAHRYPTETAARADWPLLLEQLQAPVSLENALIAAGNTAWRFQLADPDDGQALLTSESLYAGLAEAAIAYEALIDAAQDIANYTPRPNGRLEVRFQYQKPTGYNDKTESPEFETIEDFALSAYPLPAGAETQMAGLVKQKYERLKTLSTPDSTYFHRFLVPGVQQGHVYDLLGMVQYPSEDAAWATVPGLLDLFKQRGVSVEKSPDYDYFRVVLRNGKGSEVAADMEEYPKLPALRPFDTLKLKADLIGDTFGYRIGFLDCACELQYFYSTGDFVFNTKGAAAAAGQAIFKNIQRECPSPATVDTYTIVVAGNTLQIVDCVNNIVQATAVIDHSNPNNTREAAFSFWESTLLSISNMDTQISSVDYQPAESFRQLPGLATDVKQTNTELSRFRLRDDAYAIACYYQTFTTPDERINQAFLFRQYWQKADRRFPVATGAMTFQASGQVVIAGNGEQCAPPRRIQPWCYRFSLNCGSQTYIFDSVAPYESEEDARAQVADAALIAQVNLLADPAAYLIVDVDGACKTFCLQIFDYKNAVLKPKLTLSSTFSSEMEALMAQKAILKCATAYPVYLDHEGKIRFRLVQWLEPDPASDALKYIYPWLSIPTYPSLQEANCAFREFLRLLEYPANIRCTEKPWGLDVGEVMLESVYFDRPPKSEYPNCTAAVSRELNIWEKGVEGQLMSRVFQPDGVVIVSEADCVANGQMGLDYTELTHPFVYAERNIANAVVQNIQQNYASKKYPVFDLIKLNLQTAQPSKKSASRSITAERYFTFSIDARDEQNEIDVVWKIFPEEHLDTIKTEGWYLFEKAAVHETSYNIGTTSNQKHILQLTGASGIVAHAYIKGSAAFSREYAHKAVYTTIERAKEHPVKREYNQKYSIRIKWPAAWIMQQNESKMARRGNDTPENIWEIDKQFDTAKAAESFVTDYLAVLLHHEVFKDPSAYIPTEIIHKDGSLGYGFKTQNVLGVAMASPQDCCSYFYQVVNDGYLMAHHPHWYRDAVERTRHKKAIQRSYRCGQSPWSNFIILHKKENQDSTKECHGQTMDVLIEGYYYFDLNTIDAGNTAVQWRIPLPPDHDNIDNTTVWHRLTPWIEYSEFYQETLLPDGNMSLSLCDEDGQVIATAWIGGESVFSQDLANNARLATIVLAREHPIKQKKTTRKNGKDEYRIRIYSRYWSPQPNADGIPGAYIWEGHYQFETADEAHAFFNQCFHAQIDQWAQGKKDTYLDTRQTDCGDFSFDLVNPDRIIARYPARFDSRHEADLSVEKMKALLNTEGFHLLENILLRPVFKPNSGDALLGLPKELTKLWGTYLKDTIDNSSNLFKSCFVKHLPGSDPYAAYVTVILPYWAPRFQNARFREFFENTMRRELPAHCRLRVVWATPRDMFDFEIKYRYWLTALAAGEPDEGKAALTQVTSRITSFYRLILDDPKSFLDEVTLS